MIFLIGKALGKIADTGKNLIMGTVTSGPVEKLVGGIFRGIGNAVEPGAGLLNKGLKGAQKTATAATKKETYSKIGKAVERGAVNVTKAGISNPESYTQIGKISEDAADNLIGKAHKAVASVTGPTHVAVANKSLIGDELNRRMKGTLNTVAAIADAATMKSKTGNAIADMLDQHKLLKAPAKMVRGVSNGLVTTGGDNLLPMGIKATGLGVVTAAAVQTAAGTPQAVQQWNRNRQGTNYDSQPVTSAPRTPAYANNGGATGDLVFALNNLRHGGMM